MPETSTVATEYLEIVHALSRAFDLPPVQRVWLPAVRDVPDKSGEFGAVILADGSVGLMFTLLGDTLPRLRQRYASHPFEGTDPVTLAQGFAETDPAQRVLGLGAANAIAQHVIRASGVALDTQTNSIASFEPGPTDRMGMVGFFPPLVQKLRARDIDLTVVELKPELVRESPRFRVTLDPAELAGCNLILCTSTLLLNDSVEAILDHCRQAEQVAVIGPSAGFLPDPLFARGIHTVGGNQILDADGFVARCEAGHKWGDTARKYCFHRDAYPGYRALLPGRAP